MNYTEAMISNIIHQKESGDNVEIINLNNLNISKISTYKTIFENVQFLSLQNNLIINLGFLKNFPNLLYLDIRGNQVSFIKFILI